MEKQEKMEEESDEQTPTVSATPSLMDVSEGGRSLGKVTSSMDISLGSERAPSSMDVSMAGERTDSKMSIPSSANDDMEMEIERMEMPNYEAGDETNSSSPDKSVVEDIESTGQSEFLMDDDFDENATFMFPPGSRESNTSVEGPATQPETEPSNDEDGSSQPNSSRSEHAPSMGDVIDEGSEGSGEEEAAQVIPVPRLKRKKAVRRRAAGARRPIPRPKTRRTKRRRSRSNSSPPASVSASASVGTFPTIVEDQVAGPSGTSGRREAKITLNLNTYLSGILSDPVIPEHSNPFSHPSTDFQVKYVMKKKEYSRLIELEITADLLKLYFVFEGESTITQVFSLDDMLEDMIYFVYMWHKSLYDIELISKIPVFTIREPAHRNLSKHNVRTTLRRLKIATETKIYVDFIPKLDSKLKPIDLTLC